MSATTLTNGECVDAIQKAVGRQPGIVQTTFDRGNGAVHIDFDPHIATEEHIKRVAELMAPHVRREMEKCTLRLGGHACEACALKLERRTRQIRGVRHATATFIGGIMSVTFDREQISSHQVIDQVRDFGAKVEPYQLPKSLTEKPAKNFAEWLERWLEGERLEIVCTGATLLFLLTAWLLPAFRGSTSIQTTLYTLAFFAGGFFGVQAAWQSLRAGTIDVDLLMVLAALGAAAVGRPLEGAMLLFLFSLSNVLQGYAIDRTRRAIHSLMKLRPEKALTKRENGTVLLPIEELQIGDLVIVRPGESVPLDSVVVEGQSSVDQSSLTGESLPVAKHVGDAVFACSLNQSGALEVRVTRLAKDSTITKLIRMVEEAQSEKAKTQRVLDQAEQYYAKAVIGLTLALIFGPPLFFHDSWPHAFYRAMTVMVVASPCALVISTPASILSAIGGAARRGVLFKGGAHLERAAGVKVIAFDKTGTLTEGKPRVTDLILLDPQVSEDQLLALAAAVEAKSEHPLAQAILSESQRRQLTLPDCVRFQAAAGQGASAEVNRVRIGVGNWRFFEHYTAPLFAEAQAAMQTLQDQGKTCMLVARLNTPAQRAELLGIVAVADVVRADAKEVIQHLKRIGIERVVMVTGDNRRVASAIARQLEVDDYHADLLPADKVRIINELGKIGPVAMVGDGVNDAPALATASVGIAMGAAGTDVAMETADVVLMSNNLQNIPFALSLSRKAREVVWQNLAFSLSVIVLLVIAALGFALPLPMGVIGHEGSTVLVCLNGLRLLAFRD